MYHSNLIEGLWSELKYIMRHAYNSIAGTDSLEDYLNEALWRRAVKMETLDDRETFILKSFKTMNSLL